MEKTRRVLGKGLEALIPKSPEPLVGGEGGRVVEVSVENIVPGRYQPREDFNEDKLNELIASIRAKGVLQPVLVRASADGKYELIAGERRYRAVRALGFPSIPALIKNISDEEVLQISIIENVQRESLNPMEEAAAYQRLIDEFYFTVDIIAQHLGKDRSTIANILRLLNLPEEIQSKVREGKLSSGHARVLLSLPGIEVQIEISEKIIAKGLSVRETESLIKASAPSHFKVRRRVVSQVSPEVREVEEKMQSALGTKVRILQGKKRGQIHIDFYSIEDLDRIMDRLI